MSYIEVNTNTTVAAIQWKNLDAASASYSYSVLILKAGDGSNVTSRVRDIPSVTIPGLIPGVSYEVKIFTKIRNTEVGNEVPGQKLFCMGE